MIILEIIELLDFTPISLHRIEKKTKIKFTTIRSQIEFLELLELIEVQRIQKNKLHHNKIILTPLGNKLKEKINFNLH